MSGASFDLESLAETFRWMGELSHALHENGWSKHDIQCLSEVPAASRAARLAMRDWSFNIVRDALAGVMHAKIEKLDYGMVYRLIREWESSPKENPDISAPYIGSEDFKSSVYRRDTTGIRINRFPEGDTEEPHYLLVIRLDREADAEYQGKCIWDLYQLDEHEQIVGLPNGNWQNFTSPRELAMDIRHQISTFER